LIIGAEVAVGFAGAAQRLELTRGRATVAIGRVTVVALLAGVDSAVATRYRRPPRECVDRKDGEQQSHSEIGANYASGPNHESPFAPVRG
jgi:hypothetical protein